MSYQSEKEAYIAKHSKAEWTAKNRKRDLKRRAKYPEKTREKDRQHSAKWRKENPEAWGIINRRAQKRYRDLGYV
jgi:hypothetical protein